MDDAPIFLNMDRAACEAEIARLKTDEDESRRAGCQIDAEAYRGYAGALRDAIAGIKRCPACGRKRDKRFS